MPVFLLGGRGQHLYDPDMIQCLQYNWSNYYGTVSFKSTAIYHIRMTFVQQVISGSRRSGGIGAEAEILGSLPFAQNRVCASCAQVSTRIEHLQTGDLVQLVLH